MNINIKKSLAKLIVFSLLFATGCSNYQVKDTGVKLPDEATIQQTMTKVQNDNNEIMNKDYEYILSNLGEPNVTTYWADKSQIKNIDNIEGVRNLANVDLLYLKNISNDKQENSALYIQLEDNAVKKVQSIDYSKSDMLDDFYKSKIAIDCYKDYDTLKLSDIKSKNLKDFEGIDYDQYTKIVGDSQCIYDAYFYDDDEEKAVEVFALDDEDKILCIFSKDDKITKVEITTYENVTDEAKDILLQK